jgi:hypothetical protein
MYLGHLIQGKSSRPNYKVKEQLPVNKSDWIRVEQTHEAIISKTDFALVQKLLLLDSRVAPGKSHLYLFSGVLYCGRCRQILLRRTIRKKKTEYVYYGCYTKDKKLNCPGIAIREIVLEKILLLLLQVHMDCCVNIAGIRSKIEYRRQHQNSIIEIEKQIQFMNEQMLQYQNLYICLNKHLKENLISEDEYIDLENIYRAEENQLVEYLSKIEITRRNMLSGNSIKLQLLDYYEKHHKLKKIDRRIVVTMVSEMTLKQRKNICIRVNYQDEFIQLKK